MNISGNLLKNIAIGILGAACLYSVLTITNYNHLLQVNEAVSQYLEHENSVIKKKYDSLQVEYNKQQLNYIKLDSIFENKNKQYNLLKLENSYLQSKLADIENDMINITSDSSYNYLMHRYIPKTDSVSYKFAPNQVKFIHKDVLFLDQNIKLNKKLNETVETLFDLYTNSNLMFNTCENQKSILLNQKDLMQNSINNLTEINKSYTKEIKKQRVKSTAFGIGAAGLVTYIIIKSVSNK